MNFAKLLLWTVILSGTVMAKADNSKQIRSENNLNLIKNLPIANIDRNTFGNGLHLLLTNKKTNAIHCRDHEATMTMVYPPSNATFDYDILMGDLGLAFAMQASNRVAIINGALDVGWWPLAWDCLPILLKPYQATVGIEINWLGTSYENYKVNPQDYFRSTLQQPLQQVLNGGQQALVNDALWHIAVQYDATAKIPLLCVCPNADNTSGETLSSYPIFAVTLGEKIIPRTRVDADITALQQAVALGRDLIPMPNGYVTGQKAFALWIMTLRDFEHRGQARYHANVVRNLKTNRLSAIKYLSAMINRVPTDTVTHLNNAINHYVKVLQTLEDADTSESALIDATPGREKLALQIEKIAGLETHAISELELAIKTLDKTQKQ